MRINHGSSIPETEQSAPVGEQAKEIMRLTKERNCGKCNSWQQDGVIDSIGVCVLLSSLPRGAAGVMMSTAIGTETVYTGIRFGCNYYTALDPNRPKRMTSIDAAVAIGPAQQASRMSFAGFDRFMERIEQLEREAKEKPIKEHLD